MADSRKVTMARRLAARAPRATRRYGRRFLRLEQLGAWYGTDKVDRWHTHVGRTNCAIYERYLSAWRRKQFTLLEIGVLSGASLRMWQAFFPRARVRGLDIDPAAGSLGLDVTIGSQADPDVLEGLVSPDLAFVIDDGSHVIELTIATFEYLFPRLESGAVYIIEDTLNTYEPARSDWPGMSYNEGLSLENVRADFDAFLARLMHDCDAHPASVRQREGGDLEVDVGPDRTVSFVHVWPGLIVVGRA